MTIDAFIADPNKIGTCFATMRKKKSKAVKYIMAWTDCGVSEAVSLIHSFEESSDYANYLGTVSRAEADMLRAEIERRRAEERLRIQSQSRPEPVVEQRKVERKLNKPIKKSHERTEIKNLYLIDGDNHIYEAIERIGLADDTDIIKIYVSQDGLYDKLLKEKMHHVEVILVPPGDQAVDKRIKSVLGNAVKQDYSDIFVISNDKGYQEKLQEYRCKYKRKKNSLDLRKKF